jgi:hypothetical protein
LDFEFWDLPGGRYDVEHLENLDLQSVGACLFVIDAQVGYSRPISEVFANL